MERGKLILVTGGARSGKSRLAEGLAKDLVRDRAAADPSQPQVIYLATAEAGDTEMQERIRRHQQRRPAAWETIEESFAAEAVIRTNGENAPVILLDCLAILLSNWLLTEYGTGEDSDGPELNHLAESQSQELLDRVAALARTAREAASHVIIVTNEVGLGLVPANPLGRLYRDLLGLSNQLVAAQADEVYLVWVGIPQKIKG